VTDENETTEQESAGIPPQAFDRVKAEAASFKEAAEVSGQALAKREWVDQLYDHFNGLEGDSKPANSYEAARAAANRLPEQQPTDYLWERRTSPKPSPHSKPKCRVCSPRL